MFSVEDERFNDKLSVFMIPNSTGLLRQPRRLGFDNRNQLRFSSGLTFLLATLCMQVLQYDSYFSRWMLGRSGVALKI